MEKNFEVEISDLDMFGRGIGHKDGSTIFVENALINETVKCEKIREQKNLIFAKSKEIIKKSEYRLTPLCQYFFVCGGCDLQHFDYEKTLQFKKNQIKIAFKKIANIDLCDFNIYKSPKKFFYRNKVSFKIFENNGVKKLGFYEKNSHKIVEISSCKILDEKFDFVINSVNEFLKFCPIKAFDEKTKKGCLKHCVCRIIENSVLLTFVLNDNKKLANIQLLYENLKQQFDDVGISKNINNKASQILSDKFEHILGNKTIKFEEFGISQQISNASFLQVNTFVANEIYKYVLQNLTGNVVNAYSGAGLLSAIIAKNNAECKVFGIEINKESTRLADEMKSENKILNLTNLCGDSAKLLEKINLKEFNLVVDPPRSGLDKNMIDVIKKFLPSKIVYISCNKNTLAKNVKELEDYYALFDICAFDMFPQTKDEETVVILKKIR